VEVLIKLNKINIITIIMATIKNILMTIMVTPMVDIATIKNNQKITTILMVKVINTHMIMATPRVKDMFTPKSLNIPMVMIIQKVIRIGKNTKIHIIPMRIRTQ
jgi:hypothetical protein